MSKSNSDRSFEDVKNLVKDRADFAGIVSRHTKLIKTAKGFKACCPIHKEKTPSFHLDTRANYFYCYGCNRGGDVFTFLELTEGLPFFEALKELAEELHIELPKIQKSSAQTKGERSRRDRGFELLQRAQIFYNRYLTQSPTIEAETARKYLKARGITDEEIQIFGIGLSPDAPNALAKKLENPEDVQIATAADLLRNYQNKIYDSFRARLMIPIRDIKSRVVGFSGRVLEGAAPNQPKYKNTSETEWFKKKEILYGLDLAVKQIRSDEYVCLVEGFFDQWAFYKKEIPAVAVMGTALSEEHLEQLSRHTQNMILVLDTDKAGLAATQKSLPVMLKRDVSVRVFSELNGKDPDEWLATFVGKATDVKKKLLTSPSGIEWWTRTRLKERLAQNPDRLSAIKALHELWSWTQNAAQRNILADEAGKLLGLPAKDIKESLQEVRLQQSVRPSVQDSRQNFSRRLPAAKAFSPMKLYAGPVEVLAQESLILWAQNLQWLGPDTPKDWTNFEKIFEGTPIMPLISDWKAQWPSENDVEKRRSLIEKSIEKLDSESRARGWLLKALVGKDSGQGLAEAPEKDKILKSWGEFSVKIEKARIREEMVKLQSKIREAAMDPEQSEKLLLRVQELMKELHF